MSTTKRRHRSPKPVDRNACRYVFDLNFLPEADGVRVVQRKRMRGNPRVLWERRSRQTYGSQAEALIEMQLGVLLWTSNYRVH